MDFDLAALPVPFRMQPGLRRLAAEEPVLSHLDPASALAAEKRAVWQAGASRFAVPGFDATPAIESIATELGGTPTGAWLDPKTPLELQVREDLAVLDGDTGTLPWLCVCTPSHWAPEDKAGLHFTALHAPVADNAALIAAAQPLVALVTGGERWERHVWTISPSPRFDQHPLRHPRTPWPAIDDPNAFAAACWLRVERQCFFPVGRGTCQAVFSIRLMLQPLAEAANTAARAKRLAESLASMSPAVLAYKGLSPARDRLLRWLDRHITALSSTP